MNDNKTEFALFGSRQQLNKCTSLSLMVNENGVGRVKTVNYLGAHLDEELNLRSHIVNKCKVACFGLQRIRRIRPFLTTDACVTIVTGMVLSHLDYANGMFANLSEKTNKTHATDPKHGSQSGASKKET